MNTEQKFIFLVSGLISGDKKFLEEYLGLAEDIDIRFLSEVCQNFRDSGNVRESRKGWLTLDHPVLGMVQWKLGWNFRNAKEYFFLRVNGRLVVFDWPAYGREVEEVWASAPESVPLYIRHQVAIWLLARRK